MKVFGIISLSLGFWLIGSTLEAQSVFDTWPALKDFHGVMSQTFHPAEEGNLAPIKARSLEMYDKAMALSKSTTPAALNTKPIKMAVKELVKGSKSLHKLIKSPTATDAAITNSLTALHDVFHKIVGLCREEH